MVGLRECERTEPKQPCKPRAHALALAPPPSHHHTHLDITHATKHRHTVTAHATKHSESGSHVTRSDDQLYKPLLSPKVPRVHMCAARAANNPPKSCTASPMACTLLLYSAQRGRGGSHTAMGPGPRAIRHRDSQLSVMLFRLSSAAILAALSSLASLAARSFYLAARSASLAFFSAASRLALSAASRLTLSSAYFGSHSIL